MTTLLLVKTMDVQAAPQAVLVPPEVMVAEVPPTVTVRAWLATNPVPLMVTPVVPTGPLVGLGAPTDDVTAKLVVEEAETLPTVTTIEWAPAALAGATNVGGLTTGMLPALSVVVLPDRATGEPSYLAVIVVLVTTWAAPPHPANDTANPRSDAIYRAQHLNLF